MQEIHTIGSGGRVFGDRRLRPHGHHHHQQALKCPRCDSLNTKFCYYNNYNLSQPRHFCKNCRRYWTKGGILRNVPVGGGCRKSRRSSKPKSSSAASPSRRAANSLSSSESSVTTAGGAVFQVTESDNLGSNVRLEPLMELSRQIEDNRVLLSSETGGFANLMSNPADPLAQLLQHTQTQWEIGGGDEKIPAGMLDPTVRIELDDLQQDRGGFAALGLSWPASETAACDRSGDEGLFDLLHSTAVNHESYWSQTTSSDSHLHLHPHANPQWSDHVNSDLPLFLP